MIVSGPSGAGKTTIVSELFDRCELPLVPSVSATTRGPRAGEKDGVDYFFLSKEDFERKRIAGEFLECCEVFSSGDWYGTLRGQVEPRLAQGNWVVLEIDVQGAQAVLKGYPRAITIFIRPASLGVLEERLRQRGSENPASLERRLQAARRELSYADQYRCQVVNEDIGRAVQQICDFLKQEKGE